MKAYITRLHKYQRSTMNRFFPTTSTSLNFEYKRVNNIEI